MRARAVLLLFLASALSLNLYAASTWQSCKAALAGLAVCAGLHGCANLGPDYFKREMGDEDNGIGRRQWARARYLEESYESIEKRLEKVSETLSKPDRDEGTMTWVTSELDGVKHDLAVLRKVIVVPLSLKGEFVQEGTNITHDAFFWKEAYGATRYKVGEWKAGSIIFIVPIAYVLPEFLLVVLADGLTGWRIAGPLDIDHEMAELHKFDQKVAALEAEAGLLSTNGQRNALNWRFNIRYTIQVPVNGFQAYLSEYQELAQQGVLPGIVPESFSEEPFPFYVRKNAGRHYAVIWNQIKSDIRNSRSAQRADQGWVANAQVQINEGAPISDTHLSLEVVGTIDAFIPQDARAEILQKISGRSGINQEGVEFVSKAADRALQFKASWIGPATPVEEEKAENDSLELQLRREFGE